MPRTLNAEHGAAEDGTPTKSAMLLRLLRRRTSPNLQTAVTEIVGPGDLVEQLGVMEPAGFNVVEVGDR